jgi:hypothetical protein
VLEVHAVEEIKTQQIALKDLRTPRIRLLDGDLICMLDTKITEYKGNKVTMVTK